MSWGVRRYQLLSSIGAGTPPDLFVLLGHLPEPPAPTHQRPRTGLVRDICLYLIGCRSSLLISLEFLAFSSTLLIHTSALGTQEHLRYKFIVTVMLFE